MRVTTSQAQRSQLDYIQGNLQRLVKAQDQAATGQRYDRGSDDVVATSEVLRIDGALSGYTQFIRSGELAIGRANEEDRVLNNLQQLGERAQELASQQIGSTANAQTRLIVKAEVDQLISSALALGNTRFNDGYLFGGSRPDQAPLADTPNSVPPYMTNATAPGNPEFEVAAGILSAPTHNANEIFADTNLLTTLRDLSAALGNNDVPGISGALAALPAVGDGIGRLLGDVGAKVNQYEMLANEHRTASVDAKVRRSTLYDIDLAEASANFAQAQTAYQAALSAANRVLNLNIMDYLR
jgi:flagellar hook-associated protein 3 FlgL